MAFSDPQKIIDDLNLSEGQVVADLGTGTGFYSLAAAKAVGEHGKVYAVDIQQSLLSRLKSAAQAAHLRNIEVLHGDIEHPGGTRIKDLAVDVVIAANVLFQVESKESFVDEISRILKSGGRLLIVDWSDSFGGMGPHGSAVVTQQSARDLFEQKGYSFVTGLLAGDHHYGLIFRKK